MFEILSQLVLETLSKIVDQALNLKTQSISSKRTFLSKLLKLYNALENLEISSIAAYEEFSSYANGNSVPTKVIAKKRLLALADSYEEYTRNLREIGSILSIYDRPLIVRLRQAGAGKTSLVEQLSDDFQSQRRRSNKSVVIDLTSEVYPKQIIENGRLTSRISYPTALPDVKIDYTRYEKLTDDQLEKEAVKLSKDLKGFFKFKTVDFESPDNLAKVLQAGRSNIALIQKARTELSQVITENFPLGKLLETQDFL